MNACQFFFVLVSGAALGQGQDDYYASVTAATRELAGQLEALQLSFANIPGRPDGRGLFSQSDLIRLDVMNFRERLSQKPAREQLFIAFDKIDEKLNTLLGDLQGFTTWEPSVRMAVRKTRAAQNDLHFAVAGSDAPTARQAQLPYRQTLVLRDRTENLENLVNYVFDSANVPGWTPLFGEMKQGLDALQKLQKAKADKSDIQTQLITTDKAWEKLVAKYQGLPEGQHLLLRQGFAQVDRTLDRLAGVYGLRNRRPVLKATE